MYEATLMTLTGHHPIGAKGSAQGPDNRSSQSVEEIDQVLFLLSRETDGESLVIKVHYIQESGCRAIVEVRRPCSEPPENGSFDLADVGAIAGNQCTSRVSDHETLTGQGTRGAPKREHRQSGNIEGWRFV